MTENDRYNYLIQSSTGYNSKAINNKDIFVFVFVLLTKAFCSYCCPETRRNSHQGVLAYRPWKPITHITCNLQTHKTHNKLITRRYKMKEKTLKVDYIINKPILLYKQSNLPPPGCHISRASPFSTLKNLIFNCFLIVL